MRIRSLTIAAAALLAVATATRAEDLTSGIEVGGKIGAYSGTKTGGAEDGVEVGKSLCYTWRLGGRPVVFVFAKTPDDALASLVKEIDKVVKANEEKKVAAVVNFFGEPNDEYTEQVKQFGEKHKLENVALVVTKDGDKFKVNPDAEVTVMHYVGKKVLFNQALAKGKLDEKAVKTIVDGTSTILGKEEK